MGWATVDEYRERLMNADREQSNVDVDRRVDTTAAWDDHVVQYAGGTDQQSTLPRPEP